MSTSDTSVTDNNKNQTSSTQQLNTPIDRSNFLEIIMTVGTLLEKRSTVSSVDVQKSIQSNKNKLIAYETIEACFNFLIDCGFVEIHSGGEKKTILYTRFITEQDKNKIKRAIRDGR